MGPRPQDIVGFTHESQRFIQLSAVASLPCFHGFSKTGNSVSAANTQGVQWKQNKTKATRAQPPALARWPTLATLCQDRQPRYPLSLFQKSMTTTKTIIVAMPPTTKTTTHRQNQQQHSQQQHLQTPSTATLKVGSKKTIPCHKIKSKDVGNSHNNWRSSKLMVKTCK